MEKKEIVFTSECSAELQTNELDWSQPVAPRKLRIRTRYSLISPGTELACYKGTEWWAPFPHAPGYAATAEIVEVGAEVEGFAKGDFVFCYNPHATYSEVDMDEWFAVKLEEADLKLAPFVRMAAVAITAVQTSELSLGDWVVVQGMGMVGNLAAQLLTLSGARVIGIDISDTRLELASKCGIGHVINSKNEDVAERVKAITGGDMASTVVEATGIPDLVKPACELAAKGGEVILLGSPRGEAKTNATDILNKVHLWDNGCITMKGGHEWRIPIHKQDFVKHSIERNCAILLDLIQRNQLKVEPLLTSVRSPEEAQAAYQDLMTAPDAHMGIIYDWSNV